MDYKSIYNSIIDRARNRSILPGHYYETHHCMPKCLGGTDCKTNLVNLFPEEHYIAHQILVKLYPNNPKVLYAAHCMTIRNPSQSARSNKMYGWLRRRVNEAMKSRIGHNKGKTLPQETKDKMSLSQTKRFSSGVADTTRAKMSLKQKGRILSAETKAKMSSSHQRRWAIRKQNIET